MKLRKFRLLRGEAAFKFRNLAILDFRGARQVTGVANLIELQLELFQFRLGSSHALDCLFFRLPFRLHPRRFLLKIGDALFNLFQACLGSFVFFALQRLTLNLQLQNFAFKLIDLLRQ